MNTTAIATVFSLMIWVVLAQKTNRQTWGDLEWLAFSLSLFLFLIVLLLAQLLDTTIAAAKKETKV